MGGIHGGDEIADPDDYQTQADPDEHLDAKQSTIIHSDGDTGANSDFSFFDPTKIGSRRVPCNVSPDHAIPNGDTAVPGRASGCSFGLAVLAKPADQSMTIRAPLLNNPPV